MCKYCEFKFKSDKGVFSKSNLLHLDMNGSNANLAISNTIGPIINIALQAGNEDFPGSQCQLSTARCAGGNAGK